MQTNKSSIISSENINALISIQTKCSHLNVVLYIIAEFLTLLSFAVLSSKMLDQPMQLLLWDK